MPRIPVLHVLMDNISAMEIVSPALLFLLTVSPAARPHLPTVSSAQEDSTLIRAVVPSAQQDVWPAQVQDSALRQHPDIISSKKKTEATQERSRYAPVPALPVLEIPKPVSAVSLITHSMVPSASITTKLNSPWCWPPQVLVPLEVMDPALPTILQQE